MPKYYISCRRSANWEWVPRSWFGNWHIPRFSVYLERQSRQQNCMTETHLWQSTYDTVSHLVDGYAPMFWWHHQRAVFDVLNSAPFLSHRKRFCCTRNCFSAIVSRIIHFGDIYHVLMLLQINIHVRSSYKHRNRGVVPIISIVFHPCHSVLALLTITMLFKDVINISSILNTSVGINSENNATRIYI